MQGLFSLLMFAAFFYFMMRFGCGAHMVHGHGGHGGGHKHGGDGAVGFCSRACLDKFEANPDQYLTKAGGAR